MTAVALRPTLTFDHALCLACKSCELACAAAHSRSGRLESAVLEEIRSQARITIAAAAEGMRAIVCEQCEEPLCVFACKSGALHRDPSTGRIELDERRCVGCFMCVMVCPSGVRSDGVRDRVVRCDVCRDREVVACVRGCPTGALGIGGKLHEVVETDFVGRVVVVGSSAAGMAACEAAREHAPFCSITLVTADDRASYSRPLLSYVLAGRVDHADLDWRPADYLERTLGVTLLRGARAVRLDPESHAVLLDDGRAVSFDRLVIATGARAAALDIPGAGLGGVHAVRDLADVEQIDRAVASGRRAVVLGGGNVGLQIAEALVERGVLVTVVVSSSHLLSQMVDAEAGRRVGELFARRGVTVRTRRDAREIVGTERVEGVRLDDGELLPADLVIVGKGIRPNVEWLEGSGVTIGRGVTVDDCGRTSVEGIFAAGDCAELHDPLTGAMAVSGIWPVAYESGRAAGRAAVGVERPSPGALRLNASRFFGESIISIGEVRPERVDGGVAMILASDDRLYRKLVTSRGRLVGALLMGDIRGAGALYRLYRDGVPLGEKTRLDALDDRHVERVLGDLVTTADGGLARSMAAAESVG